MTAPATALSGGFVLPRIIVSSLLLLALVGPLHADPLRSEPRSGAAPTVGVESLAWMAGRWTCEALGGQAEDLWAPPAGGQMAGLFRLVKAEGPSFYEIMLMLMVDGRLTLRLKHFDAELRGWEEKDATVDFPLVDHEHDTWYFDGLTIERTGEDGMTMHLQVGGGGGEHIVEFTYERVGRL